MEKINFFSNRILLGSISGSILLILLVVHTPGVRDFLRFAPLQWLDWLYVLGAAAIYLTAFEALKVFRRISGKMKEKGNLNNQR